MSDRTLWLVESVGDVLRDIEALSRPDRMSLFTAVDKLTQLGPQLQPPHMKSLKGEPDLFELRPKQGTSAVRAIYARIDDGYKILVVCTKRDFDRAASRARERAAKYGIVLGR